MYGDKKKTLSRCHQSATKVGVQTQTPATDSMIRETD